MPGVVDDPRPVLVGREAERLELEAALQSALAGNGRTVLISGDAGIGKSTLVDWLAGRAATAGVRVARGYCSPAGMPPLWPWRRVLEAIRPEWGWPVDGSVPAGGERDALVAAVVDAVAEAAAAQPLLLAVEDLHWADPATLVVMRALADATPGVPALLLLTWRDDPLESSRRIHAHVTQLPPRVRRLALPPLELGAVAALGTRILGRPVTDREAAELQLRTGGNPFFVTEVARLVAARGESAAVIVPSGVREVLQRRLARLSQECVALLGVAALTAASASEEIETGLLATVSGHADAEVLDVLAEAGRAGLLAARAPSGYRFPHALVREVLEGDLDAGVAATLHARIAAALEDGNERVPAARLAHHWERAVGDEARIRAAAWSLRAAREAATEFGFETAVAHYRLALEGPAADSIAVAVEYGHALVLSGNPGEARRVLVAAAQDAAAAGRSDQLAEAALALGGGAAGFEVPSYDDEQIQLLSRADAALPPDRLALRAAVRGRLSIALGGTASVAERVQLAEDAVRWARQAADKRIEAAVLAAYCDAVAGPDFVAARLEAATRMLALARDEDAPNLREVALVLLARRLLLVAHLEAGDFAAAGRQAAAYERVARRAGIALYGWLPEIWRAMRALLDGDPERALEHARVAEEQGRRAESGNAELMAFTVRLQAHVDLGTPAAIAAECRALVDRLLPLGIPPMYLAAPARHILAAGDDRIARTVLRVLRSGDADALPKDAEWLECHWAMAELAVALDDRPSAELLLGVLRPYEQLWAVDGVGAAVFGVVAEQLGRLASYLGDADDAARWLRTAGERYTEQGFRTLAERVGVPQPVGATGGEREVGLLRRDGDVWFVEWRGRRSNVPDSKGLRDLAELLRRPGQPVAALELVANAGGAPSEGDLGPVLDEQARRAYRRRLAELDREIDGADADADLARVERLRAERSALIDELSAALGLGGRPRRAGDAGERARKAVTMRIRSAIAGIEARDAVLGRHLRNAVRTGRYCSYQPEGSVTWSG